MSYQCELLVITREDLHMQRLVMVQCHASIYSAECLPHLLWKLSLSVGMKVTYFIWLACSGHSMEMCLQSSLHQKVCSVFEFSLVIIDMDIFNLLWIVDLDKGLTWASPRLLWPRSPIAIPKSLDSFYWLSRSSRIWRAVGADNFIWVIFPWPSSVINVNPIKEAKSLTHFNWNCSCWKMVWKIVVVCM